MGGSQTCYVTEEDRLYCKALYGAFDLFHVLVYNSASISSQLEKIMRDFLMSNHDRDNSFRWVRWGDVFHPKQDGGLSIRLPFAMNEALKTKLSRERWVIFAVLSRMAG